MRVAPLFFSGNFMWWCIIGWFVVRAEMEADVLFDSFSLLLCLLVPLLIWVAWHWEGPRSPLFALSLLGVIQPIGYLFHIWEWGIGAVRWHGDDFGVIPNVTLLGLVIKVIWESHDTAHKRTGWSPLFLSPGRPSCLP